MPNRARTARVHPHPCPRPHPHPRSFFKNDRARAVTRAVIQSVFKPILDEINKIFVKFLSNFSHFYYIFSNVFSMFNRPSEEGEFVSKPSAEHVTKDFYILW